MYKVGFVQRHASFIVMALTFLFIGSQIFLFSLDDIFPQKAVVQQTKVAASDFEAGIATPHWSSDGFSTQQFQDNLTSISNQTHAKWLELPVVFTQSDKSSVITTSEPSLSSFEGGVKKAHQAGYKLFVVPNFIVKGSWAGDIRFSSENATAFWFQTFKNFYLPYLRIAQKENVEQVAISTETDWLEVHASSNLWLQYIQEIKSFYKGSLTYDSNWGMITQPVPDWIKKSSLDYLGVSQYFPLHPIVGISLSATIKTTLDSKLRNYVKESGKKLLFSETGYRDQVDALTEPWNSNSTAEQDTTIQSEACDAVLDYIDSSKFIHGIFFWGWDDVGEFNLKDTNAAKSIGNWYNKL